MKQNLLNKMMNANEINVRTKYNRIYGSNTLVYITMANEGVRKHAKS